MFGTALCSKEWSSCGAPRCRAVCSSAVSEWHAVYEDQSFQTMLESSIFVSYIATCVRKVSLKDKLRGAVSRTGLAPGVDTPPGATLVVLACHHFKFEAEPAVRRSAWMNTHRYPKPFLFSCHLTKDFRSSLPLTTLRSVMIARQGSSYCSNARTADDASHL